MNLTNLGTMSDAELEQFRRPLVYIPDPILATTSHPVATRFFNSDELKTQIVCQYATMRLNGGVGMAAVQMKYEFPDKVPNQVIVFELPDEGPKWLINPRIIDGTDETLTFEEGCLSVPSVFFNKIERKKSVKVVTQTLGGERFTASFEGFGSVLIQHEIDHLNGIVLTDTMSTLRRARARMKVSKYLKKNRLS